MIRPDKNRVCFSIVQLKYKSPIFCVSGPRRENHCFLLLPRDKIQMQSSFSKVLRVYFGSLLIFHHSIPLKMLRTRNVLLLRSLSVFPLAGFLIFGVRKKKRKSSSSDVCRSLRWKTLRHGALDNKSVQLQESWSIKQQWKARGRGAEGREETQRLFVHHRLAILAGCAHTNTHKHGLYCTATLDPWSIFPAVWWAALVSCDQKQPPHLPLPLTLTHSSS